MRGEPSYEFDAGSHTAKAHEYVSALIDEAYQRKQSDEPMTAQERVDKADELCEAYYAQMTQMPSSAVLSRLAWYIDLDHMTDRNAHKASQAEYPILSEHQLAYRRKHESTLENVYTGKNDATIGRYTDHDGKKRRIYDYMTPERDMALMPTEHLDLYTALDSAGLTARQREAVDLVYFEGMTQEDAAEQMGVSRASLRTNIDRSISKLKEYYETMSPF